LIVFTRLSKYDPGGRADPFAKSVQGSPFLFDRVKKLAGVKFTSTPSFEGVDTVPLLPRINAPVLLLSGDKSPIASAQQQTFANTLPNGRVESIVGVGHGVNLLQPERCARAAVEFWRPMV
jgi:pimeloyl-ACP methyl ester carboxylesterase